MIRNPHNNINRVQAWVERRQSGERFRANTIAKDLDLSTATVCSVLKWQDTVRVDRTPGRTYTWVKV